jgi:O6-methylguanine-DNA--protein-cysteine methyltransferase
MTLNDMPSRVLAEPQSGADRVARGKPGSCDSQDVTVAIANSPIAAIVPYDRALKKDGSISGCRRDVCRKSALPVREQHSMEH